jgi:hypothetical protein
MNPHFARLSRLTRIPALLLITLGVPGQCLAADPGRLFYTPAQRAQLEAARASNVTRPRQAAPRVTQPVRFDGMIIRSDGASTSWVNDQPRAGTSGVAGLKPGQIRAGGKVYEPYQVLRAAPNPAIAEEPVP